MNKLNYRRFQLRLQSCLSGSSEAGETIRATGLKERYLSSFKPVLSLSCLSKYEGPDDAVLFVATIASVLEKKVCMQCRLRRDKTLKGPYPCGRLWAGQTKNDLNSRRVTSKPFALETK